VTPISTATNKAGKAIHVDGMPLRIAVTPDSRTAYVITWSDTVTPISTATNQAGHAIKLGAGVEIMVFTPGS
jgi:DNA-binding beta-propeller fold protein YncE